MILHGADHDIGRVSLARKLCPVRVLLVDTSNAPPDTVEMCLSLLSENEQERASRFLHPRDRRDFAVSHALLRRMLEARFRRPVHEWRFEDGRFGKPSVVEADLRTLGVGAHFNISHTDGLVGCALSEANSVGLDIVGDAVSPDIGEMFAWEERDYLRSVDPEERAHASAKLWSLKEAFSKCLGFGLSLPLDTFAVALEPPRLLRADGLDVRPEYWRFFLRARTPNFVVSAATTSDTSSSASFDCSRASLAWVAGLR